MYYLSIIATKYSANEAFVLNSIVLEKALHIDRFNSQSVD